VRWLKRLQLGISAALHTYGLRPSVAASYPRNTEDIDSALNAIAAKNPKAVILYAMPAASIKFIKTAAERGLKFAYAGSFPTSTSSFVHEASHLKIDYVGAMACPLPTDTSFEVIKKFEQDMQSAGFAELEPYSVEAYINTRALIEGLKRTKEEPTYAEMIAAFESLGQLDLEGVTVTWAPGDHQGFKEPFLVKIEGEKLAPLKSDKSGGPRL
jgi:branched-chain amino acid transport system substrate-binding protein